MSFAWFRGVKSSQATQKQKTTWGLELSWCVYRFASLMLFTGNVVVRCYESTFTSRRSVWMESRC